MNKIFRFLGKVITFRLPFSLLLIPLVIAGSAYGAYRLIMMYPEKVGLLKGPSIIKSEERALVTEVSKSMILPTDEEPTIATVTDPTKLADQFFFKEAVQGDKLLIYQNSKKVILYRPSERRVIEVGVVNIKQEGATGSATQNIQTVKLAILDSTKDAGLISQLETKAKGVDASIGVSKDTSRLAYNESLLVDVGGNRQALAQRLAQGLGVKTGSLPEGEKTVEGVDFILLVGTDLIVR